MKKIEVMAVKILKQLLIFFIVCTAGAVLGEYLSFSGNVLSLIILLAFLLLRIVKEHHIKETADFFLENMAFFYIPPCIGIMDSFAEISEVIIPIIVIVEISTVLTFAVTEITVTSLMKIINKKNTEEI